jgi:hypothetical protein
MSAAPAPSPGTIRAALLGEADGASYEMFDVVSVDSAGARLTGPLLLEIGEELTLQLTRGDVRVEVRGRVAAHQRKPDEPGLGTVSWVEFTDERAAEHVRKVVGA